MAKRITKPTRACNAWNAVHPIGTKVVVRTDSRGDIHTKTTSVAYVAGGHTAVIHLEDISGFYALERVTPRRGTQEGDTCNLDGCHGKLEIVHPENCTCHLAPPCDACVDNLPICNACHEPAGE